MSVSWNPESLNDWNPVPLQKKINFAVIISAKDCNPNGDPLNGNRPRVTDGNIGEISAECLKRKMRDRLQEAGHAIFVQSNDRCTDGYPSLLNRLKGVLGVKYVSNKKTRLPEAELKKACCMTWYDVRAMGQLFAYKPEGKDKETDEGKDKETEEGKGKGKGKDKGTGKGISIAVRGPVSISIAKSVEPVRVISTQITKSVNSEGDGDERGSDTMGMKHRVENGVYVFYGGISPQLAKLTGFSEEDANALKEILPRLFQNDASSARPDGSMSVLGVVWWEHDNENGQVSPKKLFDSLKVNADGTFEVEKLENGPTPETLPVW